MQAWIEITDLLGPLFPSVQDVRGEQFPGCSYSCSVQTQADWSHAGNCCPDGIAMWSNSREFEVSSAKGGAVSTTGPISVFVRDSVFTANDAPKGASLSVTSADRVRITNTSIDTPLGDSPSKPVFLTAAAIDRCLENPCAAGSQCTFRDHSTFCQMCSPTEIGLDGIFCAGCQPGTQPDASQTECVECPVGKYSTIGFCESCPGDRVSVPDRTGCAPCPVGLVPNQDGATCECQTGFYNATTERFVCKGVNEDFRDTDLLRPDASASVCEPCNDIWLGEPCMECNQGTLPHVRAGYTVPQLPPETKETSDETVAQHVFRCHSDQKVGAMRCPADPDTPGECAAGYGGYLCASCATGFGMMPSQRCEACEDTSNTAKSIGIFAAVLVALVVLVGLGIKCWSYCPAAQYVVRCAFQPMRIVITYAQVVSQLGDVLNFQYPPAFGALIDAIRPIMDVWSLLFRALGSSECFGFAGFSSSWTLRVIALPLVLCIIVLLVYCFERRTSPAKAVTHAKGNMFFAVFFCYPTVCRVAFAAFICRALSPSHHVLQADDTVLCEESGHFVLQVFSAIVIILFAFGLPVVLGFILISKARKYNRDTKSANAALARRVAEDLTVDEEAASFVIRDTVIGEDYSYLMNAYSPRFLYWEALDMLRKLALVGLVLLVGRGSTAQLAFALLLSFGFFALQVKVWPYKIDHDNTFRAATEFHVFVVIVIAMILGKMDLTRELLTDEFYDWALFVSWLVLVPIGFVVTVFAKVRFAKPALHTTESGPKRAFNRLYVGLKSEQDVHEFKVFLDRVRTQVVGEEFARVIEGGNWKSNRKTVTNVAAAASRTLSLRAADVEHAQSTARTEQSTAEPEPAPAEDKDDEPDAYYGKFDSGFEGTFADMSDYYGGLERMIGDSRKDLMAAMEEEHCDVVEGFGASDTEFSTSSYRVVATPREEWHFVVNPGRVGDLSAGIDRETGRSRGTRSKISIDELYEDAAKLISASFKELDEAKVVTAEQVRALPLLPEEIVALRLYTGPMFELYNGVLRAWGSAPRGFVASHALVGAGLDVRNRFTTTLHVLNSGVLKMSRLQPAMKVFRGISRMKLPKAFIEPTIDNVRGGVEYGFMSTTTDEAVALTFAKDSDKETASTLVVAEMGMVDRGASLTWLSQYPHEREILFPPLTAMEVTDITDFEDVGSFQVRKMTVRLNCNLMSMTIEKLLSVRKKQVQELTDIVQKDIVQHDDAPDLSRRVEQLDAVYKAVEDQDGRKFNNNAFFEETVGKVMDIMPRLGNEISMLSEHSRDVYGLVATDGEGGFASTSFDGTARLWSLNDNQAYICTDATALPAASLTLVSVGGSRLASGQFDGAITLQTCGEGGPNPSTAEDGVDQGIVDDQATVTMTTGQTEGVTALAWSGWMETTVEDSDVVVDVDGERPEKQESATRWKTPPRQSGPSSTGPQPKRSGTPPPRVSEQATQHARPSEALPPLPQPVGVPKATQQQRYRRLASGTMDGRILLWDVAQPAKEPQSLGGRNQPGLGAVGHTKAVRALVWLKRNGQPMLVSGSFDHRILVWRLSPTGLLDFDRELKDEEASTAHAGAVTALASVGGSGRKLVSGCEDGTVKVWDVLAAGGEPQTLAQHSRGVCSLAWLSHPHHHAVAGQTTWVACGLGDNTIVVRDVEGGEVVGTMRGHGGAVHALLWSEAKGWLLSGAADASIRVWRVRNDTA